MSVIEKLTEIEELFTDVAVEEFVDSVDRYSRKPSGNEDQGYKDEND